MKIPQSVVDEFMAWRKPRRGVQNPEVMDNSLWEWCVRTRESAYSVNEKLNGPDPQSAGPCWCFQRMGQPHLQLPDGRVVYIAGEHEDHYDPDFYIYNDVAIVDDTSVNILGYPCDVFPPTDFHTATLIGNNIYLIGNLGYPDDRMVGMTQTLKLDTDSWKIESLDTTGNSPGWIHDHESTISGDGKSIVATGGKIFGDRILENFDDYSLCLTTLTWTRLTERNWQRWILEREDGNANNLWGIRSEAWNREFQPDSEAAREDVSESQIELVQTLYQSPFSGDLAIEDEEKYGRRILEVSGVRVRFDEDMFGITVTIEGDIARSATDPILNHLKTTLSRIDDSPYKVVETRVGGDEA